MTIVAAGRRIGPPKDPARFPPANVPGVREAIRATLLRLAPGRVVAGAASGSDLLVLDVAGDLSIPTTLVLSSSVDEFRVTSVSDTAGGWERLYDRVVTEAAACGRLIELRLTGPFPYFVANERMLAVGEQFGEPVTMLLIWDGIRRASDDVTAHMLDLGRQHGWPAVELSTLLKDTVCATR